MMKLLTYAEAAELLGCSTRTIARRVRSGALPVVLDGGLRRIAEEDFEAYVVARRRAPVGESARVRRPRRPAGGRGSVGARQPGGRVVRLWENEP